MHVGCDLEHPTQFMNALAHSRQTNSQLGSVSLDLLKNVSWHAAAVVANLDADLFRVHFHFDFGRGRAGMPMYVGETLLQDTEQSNFDRFWKARQVGRQVK